MCNGFQGNRCFIMKNTAFCCAVAPKRWIKKKLRDWLWILSWCTPKFSPLKSKEMYGNEWGEFILQSWCFSANLSLFFPSIPSTFRCFSFCRLSHFSGMDFDGRYSSDFDPQLKVYHIKLGRTCQNFFFDSCAAVTQRCVTTQVIAEKVIQFRPALLPAIMIIRPLSLGISFNKTNFDALLNTKNVYY